MGQRTGSPHDADLESAEAFLEFYGVPFDPELVRSRRLHILRRFHDLLRQAGVADPAEREPGVAAGLLRQAYRDVAEGRIGAVDLINRAAPATEQPLQFGGRRRAESGHES